MLETDRKIKLVIVLKKKLFIMHRVQKTMCEAQTAVPVLYIPLQHERHNYLNSFYRCASYGYL